MIRGPRALRHLPQQSAVLLRALLLSPILVFTPPFRSDLKAFTVTSCPRALVTGAAGYIGRELCCQLLEDGWHVTAGVRDLNSSRARTLATLASDLAAAKDLRFRMIPLDLLDGPAIADAFGEETPTAVFHVASVFQRCTDPMSEMVEPNIATTEAIVRACAAASVRPLLVLTSSMAAVRGPGQPLREGRSSYDHHDVNTVSTPERGWGFAYQYSKRESERRAWTLARELGLQLVALCPSMVLGPERRWPATIGRESVGFSVGMVQAWLRGDEKVGSLLIVDVRDVARAHVAAARAGSAVAGERFIVSTEVRLPPRDVAEVLRSAIDEKVGGAVVAARIVADDSSDRLGLHCREVRATARDMAVDLVNVDRAVSRRLD
mmetsp:Transcript_6459/g.13244  ORF Transcript_6459/g.13244 Transcript_6459/m.13244 type:complete len:378 (+) Transcript_6459:58-1191(+)